MTVAQLITELQKVPDQSSPVKVLVKSYGDDYWDELDSIEVVAASWNEKETEVHLHG